VTQNLMADLTINTDFAQVEADQQQVNLTRFSLFFPEKREFFLENQGTFQFGSSNNAGGDVPVMFYSRRVGLDRGGVIPIDAGGRLSGRVGRYSLGLIDINTGAEQSLGAPSTNFSVARVKRDILRRSAIGAIYTGRSDAPAGAGGNVAYGVDGTFAFFGNLNINSYWAKTDSRASNRGDSSYRAQLDYGGDRYGLQLERLVVGQNFNPGVGFVRRADMQRWVGEARFSPRPRNNRVVRRYSYSVGYAQIGDHLGRLQNRDRSLAFDTEFQNADRVGASYANSYEFLPSPFTIAPGVRLPVAGYATDNVRVTYTRSIRHRIAGTTSVEQGSFYSGRKTTLGFTGGRVNAHARLSVEPSYTVNWVDLTQGSFSTHLLGSRITYTPTGLMFFSTFVQYNSSNSTFAVNSRLRWEYRPGSELFVVFNEDRDTRALGFPRLNNRAFIVKVNRLMRF
jgi:Domain of unknown function (DUF5916)